MKAKNESVYGKLCNVVYVEGKLFICHDDIKNLLKIAKNDKGYWEFEREAA